MLLNLEELRNLIETEKSRIIFSLHCHKVLPTSTSHWSKYCTFDDVKQKKSDTIIASKQSSLFPFTKWLFRKVS